MSAYSPQSHRPHPSTSTPVTSCRYEDQKFRSLQGIGQEDDDVCLFDQAYPEGGDAREPPTQTLFRSRRSNSFSSTEGFCCECDDDASKQFVPGNAGDSNNMGGTPKSQYEPCVEDCLDSGLSDNSDSEVSEACVSEEIKVDDAPRANNKEPQPRQCQVIMKRLKWDYVGSFVLTNESKQYCVFTVKANTNAASIYTVKYSQGIIEPCSKFPIEVSIQAQDYASVCQKDELRVFCFLVPSPIPQAELSNIIKRTYFHRPSMGLLFLARPKFEHPNDLLVAGVSKNDLRSKVLNNTIMHELTKVKLNIRETSKSIDFLKDVGLGVLTLISMMIAIFGTVGSILPWTFWN